MTSLARCTKENVGNYMWWWDIPVRMTLIAWEAVRMIAWSYFTQSKRNFQFPVSLNPIFNSSVTSLIKNWTENHREQFHLKNLWLGPMLTGRRSEQDWSELRSSNPTFDARDDGPLTHWSTQVAYLWPHDCTNIFHNFSFQRNVQHLNQIYFLSDDQSILTYLQYKV